MRHDRERKKKNGTRARVLSRDHHLTEVMMMVAVLVKRHVSLSAAFNLPRGSESCTIPLAATLAADTPPSPLSPPIVLHQTFTF